MRSAVATNYEVLEYTENNFGFLLKNSIESPKFYLNCLRYFGLSFRTFKMIVVLPFILLVSPIIFLNKKRQQLFSHFLKVSPCSKKQPSSNNIGKAQKRINKGSYPSSEESSNQDSKLELEITQRCRFVFSEKRRLLRLLPGQFMKRQHD